MRDSECIAVFGDWHGDHGWARLAVQSAAREGMKSLIHVGDFGLDWPGRGRGRYEDRLNRLLAATDQTLIVSPGNHDCLARAYKFPVEPDGLISWRSNIKILPKGSRTVIHGLTVGGLGGAYSPDQEWRIEGRDWWADEEPTVMDAERLVAGGPVDLLVTHDAPMGVRVVPEFDLPSDIKEKADRTRLLLAEVIQTLQPPNVVCGHWHQRVVDRIVHSKGGSTRVDVLGKEYDREGNAVLLNRESAQLRIETLHIRGPLQRER